MATVQIRTTDKAWCNRRAITTTPGNSPGYLVATIEVPAVEHTTFAGAMMIRFDLGPDRPRDHNRNAMYPPTYLVAE